MVSNADDQPAPVFAHDRPRSSDPGPGGDGDGVLESDEAIYLDRDGAKRGHTGATGLTASWRRRRPDGDPVCSDTSPGPGDGGQRPALRGRPGERVGCGVDVPATLDITTTGPVAETQRIPLGAGLPASRHGAEKRRRRRPVPLTIPDDSGTGSARRCSSPQRGRIKDIEVRLEGTALNPAIQHDFVGTS